MFKKYLKTLGYEINNFNGDTCLGLNILDFILLLGYLALVSISLWTVGINTLPYFSVVIISFRAFIKFWIKYKEIKEDKQGALAITYIIGIILYLFLTFILIIFYYFTIGTIISKVLLTLYYMIFALFETTEILVRCFKAEPHLYK